MYLWTGAHHLLWTPVSEWVQILAMAFSIMLIAPSWGATINGYMTLNGNWHLLRTNYLIKYFVAAITFYGLQTLQGPLQSVRSFSAFIHYTSWVPGHVHMGTMGWVSMLLFGAIYYMVEKMYDRPVHSVKLADTHFWLVLVGQLLMSISLWIAGVEEALMWRATAPDGSLLYTFMDAFNAARPYYWIRTGAGVVYLLGVLVFFYNLWMTMRPAPSARSAA
jgi:cytochrome c oxidase cbb3-type subunit 1